MKILIIIVIVVAVAFNCCVLACYLEEQQNPTLPDRSVSEDVATGSQLAYYHLSNTIQNVSIDSLYINSVVSNSMYNFVTTELFREYMDKNRRNTIGTYVALKCTDGSFKFYYWTVDINPVNTKAPEFRQSSYHYQIKLSWSVDKPINFDNPIIVSDKDYYQRIDITTSIEPKGLLSIVKTNLFAHKKFYVDADEALFRLDLHLASGLAPGQYTFNLTVNDGVPKYHSGFSVSTKVTLDVIY